MLRRERCNHAMPAGSGQARPCAALPGSAAANSWQDMEIRPALRAHPASWHEACLPEESKQWRGEYVARHPRLGRPCLSGARQCRAAIADPCRRGPGDGAERDVPSARSHSLEGPAHTRARRGASGLRCCVATHGRDTARGRPSAHPLGLGAHGGGHSGLPGRAAARSALHHARMRPPLPRRQGWRQGWRPGWRQGWRQGPWKDAGPRWMVPQWRDTRTRKGQGARGQVELQGVSKE